MSQSVTIKSNKYGINLILDADMPFADLIKAVVEKFKASANFFKNAKLAISFEGRHLSDEEQQQIIAAIEENTTIEILCIVESGTEHQIGRMSVVLRPSKRLPSSRMQRRIGSRSTS